MIGFNPSTIVRRGTGIILILRAAKDLFFSQKLLFRDPQSSERKCFFTSVWELVFEVQLYSIRNQLSVSLIRLRLCSDIVCVTLSFSCQCLQYKRLQTTREDIKVYCAVIFIQNLRSLERVPYVNVIAALSPDCC